MGSKKKPAAKLKPPKADIEGLFKSLYGESDRGAVLVAAQMLQNNLESLLRAYFRSVCGDAPAKEINFLLSHDGNNIFPPLGNSGPRISLCRVLGLLSDQACKAIRAIQALRSKYCAHYPGPVSLTDPHVQETLAEIRANIPKGNHPKLDFESCKTHFRQEYGNEPSEQRVEFLVSAVLLSFYTLFCEAKISLKANSPFDRTESQK